MATQLRLLHRLPNHSFRELRRIAWELIPNMMSTVILSLFSIMVVLNLLGNSLVCLVVMKDRSMRTTMNWLLVNLAISDIIVGVFSTFRFIIGDTFKNLSGTAGHVVCCLLTGGSFIWTGLLTSVLFLVVIAVERYHAVVHPLGHQTGIVAARLKSIVAACWISALAWNLPILVLRRHNDVTGSCFVSWPDPGLAQARSVWWVIMTAIVPVGIMGFLYFEIVRNLWRSASPGNVHQAAYARARKKITLMTLIVSVIYIATWIPNSIIYLLLRFSSHIEPDSPADQLGILLVTFNSCINPIVYSLHGTPFSKRLKNLICCCRPAVKRNAVAPSTIIVPRTPQRDIDDSSYRNLDFVENGIESRSLGRSNRSIRSEMNE